VVIESVEQFKAQEGVDQSRFKNSAPLCSTVVSDGEGGRCSVLGPRFGEPNDVVDLELLLKERKSGGGLGVWHSKHKLVGRQQITIIPVADGAPVALPQVAANGIGRTAPAVAVAAGR
jgi:hypothetical protein